MVHRGRPADHARPGGRRARLVTMQNYLASLRRVGADPAGRGVRGGGAAVPRAASSARSRPGGRASRRGAMRSRRRRRQVARRHSEEDMNASRRIIVTGAARGIGRAIALRLAHDAIERDGVRPGLVLADLHGDELEKPCADELRARRCERARRRRRPGRPARCPRGWWTMAAGFGGLDIVVSNAGFAVPASLLECRTDDWDRVFAVNLRAALLLGQAAHPWLKASRGSIVITTPSRAATRRCRSPPTARARPPH